MSNYEDDWEYAGTPVSADEGSTDDGSNDYDASGESGSSEPSLSDTAGADLGASEPTLGEAWAALRQQYEQAGLGAGGVASEPESPDEVVRGWSARLEQPDKYGTVDLGPERTGSDQPYPDESERAAHRPAYAGPELPTDWRAALAATPYGAPQPYEYEPGSSPEAEPVQREDEWQARAWQTQRAFDLIQSAEQADWQNRARQTKRALEILQALGNEQQPILNEWGIPNPDQALVPRFSGLPERGALQQGHEWLQQNVPGVSEAEEALGEVADKFRYFPTSVVTGEFHRGQDIQKQAFESLPPEDQKILTEGRNKGAKWQLANPQYQDAYKRYTDKQYALQLESVQGIESLEQLQQRLAEDVELHEARTHPLAQIALSYADPTNELVGLPFRMATAALNARRVGTLEKAIAGLDKADDSYRIVGSAIQSAKAEGLGSKEASRILQNVENLVVKGTRPPGIPPIAKIVAPKGTEGQDLLLEVLNKNKAPGMAPFQSLNDVAKRADEATRIVDEYRASTPGFVQFWDKPGTKPKPIDLKILMKQPLTDVDTPEVLDARLLDALTPSTWPIHTPARIQMRLDAGEGLHDYGGRHYGVVPKQGRQAFIITGNSGSGKSTIAISLAQRASGRIIDPDDALLFYSEYNGVNASALHQEAVWTYERALGKAMRNGDNVVIPRLGSDPAEVRRWRDLLAKEGYQVHLLTVDVPVETAKKSAVARFLGPEHRFVDPRIPQRVGLTPVDSYEILKKEGGFATYGLYTRGEAARPGLYKPGGVRGGLAGFPRLLEESAPGLAAGYGRRPSGYTFPRTYAGAGPAERAAGAAIATAGRARHAQTEHGTKPTSDLRALDTLGSLKADTPRIALQYMRRQLSNMGYPSAMINQLTMGEAAQIIAEGRTPKFNGAESPSGQGSARSAAPGGERSDRGDAQDELNRSSGQRPVRSQPPLSISQQMAQLYRGTIAGDDYWGRKRAAEHDGWAMVPDDLKRALEDYWRGEPLTRVQVQRLMPVYRRYVAQTDYPGDMVEWITAALKQERSPRARAGARPYATR